MSIHQEIETTLLGATWLELTRSLESSGKLREMTSPPKLEGNEPSIVTEALNDEFDSSYGSYAEYVEGFNDTLKQNIKTVPRDEAKNSFNNWLDLEIAQTIIDSEFLFRSRDFRPMISPRSYNNYLSKFIRSKLLKESFTVDDEAIELMKQYSETELTVAAYQSQSDPLIFSLIPANSTFTEGLDRITQHDVYRRLKEHYRRLGALSVAQAIQYSWQLKNNPGLPNNDRELNFRFFELPPHKVPITSNSQEDLEQGLLDHREKPIPSKYQARSLKISQDLSKGTIISTSSPKSKEGTLLVIS